MTRSLTTILVRFLAFAIFAGGVAMAGEDAKTAADVKAAAQKEKGKKPSIAELKKLLEEANKTRDEMIANHEQLAKQLKDATEEQKKEIKAKMEAQKKAFEEMTSALHKQIRDEQRKQRSQNAGTKR